MNFGNISKKLKLMSPVGFKREKFESGHNVPLRSVIVNSTYEFGLKSDSIMLNSKLSKNINDISPMELAELESTISTLLQFSAIIDLGSIIKNKTFENNFVVFNVLRGECIPEYIETDCLQEYNILQAAIAELSLVYYCGNREYILSGADSDLKRRNKTMIRLFKCFGQEGKYNKMIKAFVDSYEGEILN